MFARWLVLPLLLVPFIAGCGSSDSGGAKSTSAVDTSKAGRVAGAWTGQLHQQGLAPFRIAVRIEPSGVGRVAYTGIDCAGTWRPRGLMGFQSHFFNFIERIDRGAGGECKGTGRVNTVLDSTYRKQRLHYLFRGDGVTSRGTLHRTGSTGLNPVFGEAGVNPP
jgi:hypothetical protein